MAVGKSTNATCGTLNIRHHYGGARHNLAEVHVLGTHHRQWNYRNPTSKSHASPPLFVIPGYALYNFLCGRPRTKEPDQNITPKTGRR